jgi:hypothetical protein
MVATQTLNITQQPNDYIFELDPNLATPYPATAYGEKSFDVTAEFTWWLTEDGSEIPTGMLTIDSDAKNQHDPKPDGSEEVNVPLFTLSPNHGYQDRQATLVVMTNDQNWIPTPIVVKQRGTPPSLILTQPTEEDPILYLIDGKNTLQFSSNCYWSFDKEGGYDDVVGETKYGDVTINDSYNDRENNDALNNIVYTITLTKRTTGLPNEPGFSSTATHTGTLELAPFAELDGDDLPMPAAKTVTVKRAVIRMWNVADFDPSGDELLVDGQVVEVTAHTNMPWMVEYKIDDSDWSVLSHDTTAYNDTNNKITFSIPSNTTSLTSRTVYVTVHELPNSADFTDIGKTYTQPAATLIPGEPVNNLSIIPAAGITASVDIFVPFSGTYTGQITVAAYSNGEEVGTNTGYNNGNIGVTVGENTGWEDRDITYKWWAEYDNSNIIDLPQSFTHLQRGCTVTFEGPSTYTSNKTYYFKISGDYPSGTKILFKNETGTLHEIEANLDQSTVYSFIMPDTTDDLYVYEQINDELRDLNITLSYSPLHLMSYNGNLYGLIKMSFSRPPNTTYPTSTIFLRDLEIPLDGFTIAPLADQRAMVDKIGLYVAYGASDINHNPYEPCMTTVREESSSVNIIVVNNESFIQLRTTSPDMYSIGRTTRISPNGTILNNSDLPTLYGVRSVYVLMKNTNSN